MVLDAAQASLQAFDYGYDVDSNVVERVVTAPGNADAGTHVYGYDDAGRLTSWDPPSGPLESYGWDDSGNRVSAGSDTYAFDARNRLVSGPEGSYAYDPRGTLASITDTSTIDYTFDALGRMTDYDGSSAFTYV